MFFPSKINCKTEERPVHCDSLLPPSPLMASVELVESRNLILGAGDASVVMGAPWSSSAIVCDCPAAV